MYCLKLRSNTEMRREVPTSAQIVAYSTILPTLFLQDENGWYTNWKWCSSKNFQTHFMSSSPSILLWLNLLINLTILHLYTQVSWALIQFRVSSKVGKNECSINQKLVKCIVHQSTLSQYLMTWCLSQSSYITMWNAS